MVAVNSALLCFCQPNWLRCICFVVFACAFSLFCARVLNGCDSRVLSAAFTCVRVVHVVVSSSPSCGERQTQNEAGNKRCMCDCVCECECACVCLCMCDRRAMIFQYFCWLFFLFPLTLSVHVWVREWEDKLNKLWTKENLHKYFKERKLGQLLPVRATVCAVPVWVRWRQRERELHGQNGFLQPVEAQRKGFKTT